MMKVEPHTPLRVAVVEDHQLFREMLVSALTGQDDITVAVTSAGAQEARTLIEPGRIDVAVLDVELADGNGVALGIQLRRKDPRIGIMLLSSYDVMELLLDLPPDVRRGWSYLSKSSAVSIQTITRALRGTASGHTVLDPELVQRAVPRHGSTLARLTPRQLEVLQLLATGLSNTGIAEHLGISERSVENHLNVTYAALELPKAHNSRVSAVLRFIEETSRG
jgi:DNA-binding NarL/FixJ family response regulator